MPVPITTVISGPHIQIIDTLSGNVLYTTSGREDVSKSGPIRCAAVDRSWRYVATSGEDKLLKIWEIEGLELLNERELPKRPTAIQFTADSQKILVSDKFGDVFSYPFHFTPLTAKQKRDALSSHENPSGGQLILGHTSLLNAFLLSSDEKYIITADRDEHIRVSWYPQGYNIEMYCLGHKKFISAIHNPGFALPDLISGGGDPVLKVWDWMTGNMKYELRVLDAIQPYIKVRHKNQRGDDAEGSTETGRRKGKKGKRKGNAPNGGVTHVETTGGIDTDVNPERVPGDAHEEASNEKGELILVVHKISTVAAESGDYIVFSAVGATALFVTPYPKDSATFGIRAFDLGQPVIDFTVSEDGLIWVSVDANWSEDSPENPETKSAMIRVLKASSGELTEATLDSPLLRSLNGMCMLPATADDLRKLDLYGDLVSMPKGTEAEQELEILSPSESAAMGKQISKKELGRLRSKQAVLAKLQSNVEGVTDIPRSEGDDTKEPQTKKTKSDQ